MRMVDIGIHWSSLLRSSQPQGLPRQHDQSHHVPLDLGDCVTSELSMGPFCVTRPNPTHQLTDPTQPNPLQVKKIWTRPDPTQ